MENQSFQQDNKNLINKIRKNSNKKKRSFKWLTVLWIFAVIAIAILVLFLVFNALKPVPIDQYSQTVNITVESENPELNSENLKTIKQPGDYTVYNLVAKHDLENVNVYLRFNALTYLDDQRQSKNIIKIEIDDDENFYYDEVNDTWYYLGVVHYGDELTICNKIGVFGEKTENKYGSKSVKFYINIDAIRTSQLENYWGSESDEWRAIMTERGLLETQQTEEE